MKFCFFGYDHTLDIAQRLIADGHQLMHIFTFPCDNRFVFNQHIKYFAAQSKISLTEEPIRPKDVKRLLKKKCKLFFSSGYPHKIPVVPEDQAYAVNLHPALLPKARGIMPLPYIIAEDPKAAGFTFHKMTQEFDAGDVLFQQAIEINEQDDIETLGSKIALQCPKKASEIIGNIEKYWSNAQPQNHENASEYPQPTDEFRTLNWKDSAKAVNKKCRAFGRFGIIANIGNEAGQTQKLVVHNASAWKEEHTYEAGTLLRSQTREIVIAISDGYICLKEFQIIG